MVGKVSSASVGELVSGRVAGLGHPAGRGTGDGERLLVDGRAHRAIAGDGADRRDVLDAADHRGLGLGRHQIAAVGARADRQRLLLQQMQPARLAVAHIGLERGLVLQQRARRANGQAAELRARALQGELIDRRLVLVEGAVDALELLGGDHVLRDALLDLGEPLVVGRLERLEGAHEFVEGERHVLARAAGGLAGEVPSLDLDVVSLVHDCCSSLMSVLFWGRVVGFVFRRIMVRCLAVLRGSGSSRARTSG